MKVLFIQPPHSPNSFVSSSGLAEPLSYEILAATVPNHDAMILDMRVDKTRLEDALEAYRPDLVGVGCVTAGYKECVKVLKRVKEADPGILCVVGGHHPTVLPGDFQADIADFLVIGEGEETFKELVDSIESNKPPYKIRGLAIPQNGKVHFTGQRPLMDINRVPIPNRSLTSHYRKQYFRGNWKPIVSIVGSRGCSFRCKFCCQWRLNQGRYRARDPEAIVNELLQINEKYIDFIDDNSWENLKWVEELYEKIKENGIKKNYKLYARSDLVTKRPDLIEKWRSIGLKAVLIGFESWKNEELKRLNKKSTVSKNVEAARILKKNGIDVIGYFLVDPSYMEEDFKRLIDHVMDLDIVQPIFAILTPFPGTIFYEEVKDKIMTDNYEDFDGMHAIIPTELPLKRYYQLYGQLFKKSYPKIKLLKHLIQGKISLSLSQSYAQLRYLKRLSQTGG